MSRPRGVVPSTMLPLAYLLTAVVAFVSAAVAVPWLAPELAGHYYHPRLLALTHTVTLGWITLTIMGASYQLVPIVVERPLWSERAARWQLPVYAFGVVGVIGHFAIGHWPGFVWSAAVVALAALAHAANAGATLASAPPSFTARMVWVALGGLTLTALFGTLIGAHKVWPFLPGALFPTLHAHVHLALLGWVLPMVVGVAARVYPMFLLVAEPGGVGAHVQLAGLLVGVPFVVVGLLLDSRSITIIGTLLVTATVLTHLGWVFAMMRARKRPGLDWGLRFVLAGSVFLVPAAALGLALASDLVSGPRPAIAYAVLTLGGWASLTIVGMMLKIVPFLVWTHVYGARVGRGAVPTLAQLSSPRGEGIAFVLLTVGFGALSLAVWIGEVAVIRMAAFAVTLGALAFAATLGRVLRHLGPCPLGRREAVVTMRSAAS
jgi:hypothetical protein